MGISLTNPYELQRHIAFKQFYIRVAEFDDTRLDFVYSFSASKKIVPVFTIFSFIVFGVKR